ncbi:MAG TPA: hypothetical protein PKL83_05590, partial [bacterium]|nr:hypothetical protein [bacterium]
MCISMLGSFWQKQTDIPSTITSWTIDGSTGAILVNLTTEAGGVQLIDASQPGELIFEQSLYREAIALGLTRSLPAATESVAQVYYQTASGEWIELHEEDSEHRPDSVTEPAGISYELASLEPTDRLVYKLVIPAGTFEPVTIGTFAF